MTKDSPAANRQSSRDRAGARAAEKAARDAIIANPEFVFEDAEIMRALLEPSRPTSRKIVDLRSALVERLERRLTRLVEAHRDVIDAAWDNLSGMEQAHQAVLAMIEAESLDEVGFVVATRIPELFEADSARLCFEGATDRDSDCVTDSPEIAHLPPGFVSARVSARPRVEGSVAFAPVEPGDRAIFGPDVDKLGSVALVALDFGPGWPSGLLALGAVDSTRFGANQNAELLRFVGQAAERLLRRHLEREAPAAAPQIAAPN